MLDTVITTEYFKDNRSAMRYYGEHGCDATEVLRKIQDQEIIIGRPFKPGYVPYLNSENRWCLRIKEETPA